MLERDILSLRGGEEKVEKRTPVDMGLIVKAVRKNGQTGCPKCKEGIIFPIGEKEIAHWFVCSKCKYKIVEE